MGKRGTVGLAVGAVVLAGLIGWDLHHAATTAHNVRYEISGSAQSAQVTLSLGDGSTSSIEVTPPWRFDVKMYPGDVAAMTAGADGGIICRVYVDGHLKNSSGGGGCSVRARI